MCQSFRNKLKDRTVLVADDVDDVLFYYKAIFKLSNTRVLQARTGNEAIEVFRLHPETDAVLLDIQMPNGDGIMAMHGIREINNDVPIIAQTAHALPHDKKKFIAEGFNNYLSKPIRSSELFEVLAQYVK